MNASIWKMKNIRHSAYNWNAHSDGMRKCKKIFNFLLLIYLALHCYTCIASGCHSNVKCDKSVLFHNFSKTVGQRTVVGRIEHFISHSTAKIEQFCEISDKTKDRGEKRNGVDIDTSMKWIETNVECCWWLKGTSKIHSIKSEQCSHIAYTTPTAHV